MANPKSKILPSIFSTFAVIAVFYCVGSFSSLLGYDFSMFGANVIGAALGIVSVIVVCLSKNRPLISIGVNFDPLRILRGLVVGLCISMIPMAVVTAIRFGLYKVTGLTSLAIKFLPPNSDGSPSLMNIGLFAIGCCVSAVMQELCFRGYVIRSMRPKYPFFDANAVQAGLSVVLPLITIVKNIVMGSYSSRSGASLWIFIGATVLFFVAHTFCSSIKRGFIARVSGDIWSSFFDNFFVMFVNGSIFIQSDVMSSYFSMLSLLIAEGLSLLIAYKYYRKQYTRNAQRKEKRQNEIAKKIEERYLEELNREEDPDIESISTTSVKEIMEQHTRKIYESVGSHTRQIHSNENENIVSFDQAKQSDDNQ